MVGEPLHGTRDAPAPAGMIEEDDLFQRARLERLPIEWVVFLDVEAVQTHMPAVDAEPGFWPTILAVTNSEQISTVFVVNDTNATSSFLRRHRQDMDYSLRFSAAGPIRTFTIEKSADNVQGATFKFDVKGGPVVMLDAT